MAAILFAAAAGFAHTANAQTLEEIVVTAERREQTLRQTPISVAAFTAESMEIKGIETLEDVATFTPNLDIKGSRGTGNVSPTYQIRGLSGGGGATGERSAALYVDGVYMPRTAGPFMNVLDIERVEILRGPQGTLFGRNSTGGAIRVFTNRPGPEPGGYVRVAAGNFERGDLSAMVNVPLSDTVFFRAQAGYLSQDGYVSRGSQELGSFEDTLGRLQLGLRPSERLSVDLSLSSAESNSDGNPQDLATFDMRPDLDYEGQRADWVSDFLEADGQARLAAYNDPRIVLDDYTMPNWCFVDDIDPDWDPACEQRNDGQLQQLTANVEWRISDVVDLTSVTGISEYEADGVTDWVMLGTESRINDVNSDVLYQELQLNFSLADGRADLVTGISYFDEDSWSDEHNLERLGTSAFPPQLALGNGDGGLARTDDMLTRQTAESWGLFANLTWNLTDRFALTPGVRFAFDEKSVTATEFNGDDWTAFEGTSTTVVAFYDEDDVDWRLTADYDVNEDHMIYATASKSFRAGALALPGMEPIRQDSSGEAQSAVFAETPPFTPPESVQNSEIGLRSDLGDGRVRLNLTYFDMNYSDRQGPVQVPDDSPTGFRIQIQNTGDVDLSGLELEGQIAASDNFMVDFSAGLVDSTLHDVCANNGDFLFPGPVEESYSLGVRWADTIGAGRDLSWSLNYGWVGEQQTHPGGTNADCGTTGPPPGWPAAPAWFFDSRYELPDYGLLNGRVSLASADGRWTLTLFGNNLTDEVYATYASRFGGGFWDFVPPWVQPDIQEHERSALGNTMGRPRELGVSFRYNFGAAAPAR